MTNEEKTAWLEYDIAALWCAKRKIYKYNNRDLPYPIGSLTLQLIEDDPEAFEERIKQTAYAEAMEEIHKKYGDDLP